MTSCSEKRPSHAPATLIEDEMPVLNHVRRTSTSDAAPEVISDEEPTVRINLRRAGFHVTDRPAR